MYRLGGNHVAGIPLSFNSHKRVVPDRHAHRQLSRFDLTTRRRNAFRNSGAGGKNPLDIPKEILMQTLTSSAQRMSSGNGSNTTKMVQSYRPRVDTLSGASTRSNRSDDLHMHSSTRRVDGHIVRERGEARSHVLEAHTDTKGAPWSDEVKHISDEEIESYLSGYDNFKQALEDVLLKGKSKKHVSEKLDPTVAEVAAWLARKWKKSRNKFNLPHQLDDYMSCAASDAHKNNENRLNKHSSRLSTETESVRSNEDDVEVTDSQAKKIISNAEAAIQNLQNPRTLFHASRAAVIRRNRENASRRRNRDDSISKTPQNDLLNQNSEESAYRTAGDDGKTQKNSSLEGSSGESQTYSPPIEAVEAAKPNLDSVSSESRSARRLSAIEDMMTHEESSEELVEPKEASVENRNRFSSLKAHVDAHTSVSSQKNSHRGKQKQRRASVEVLQRALKSLESPYDAY